MGVCGHNCVDEEGSVCTMPPVTQYKGQACLLIPCQVMEERDEVLLDIFWLHNFSKFLSRGEYNVITTSLLNSCHNNSPLVFQQQLCAPLEYHQNPAYRTSWGGGQGGQGGQGEGRRGERGEIHMGEKIVCKVHCT